jgi:hypothetical protein
MKLDIQLFATTLKDANSNGSSVGGTSNAYNFRYTVVLNSQNKEANTSNITVKHYGKGLQRFTYSGFTSPKSYVYVYNKSGTQIGYGDAVVRSMSTSEKTLCTVTLNIPHDDEGKLTFSVKVVYKPNTTSYNYLPANKTISSGNITNTPQILRAPNVQVDSYEIYNNSIRVGVHSTNSIALNQVQVSYTEDGTTYSYMEEVDEDGYIYLLGLNPKTTYTFNLKGYNNANSALETTGVDVTYTTGPNPIGVNSITVDLNNASYNNDSIETWTVGFLTNLSYGNGNSISDLYSINYIIEDSQGVVVGTGSKYQNNYASYFYLSELNPEETYKVTAEALTYMTPGSTSYWTESTSRYFTTLDKNKKAWIKNSQNQWAQGILYIKTDSGWKIAKKIYRKTGENTWTESIN